MATTNEQIQQWFQQNPNANESDIYTAMQANKVDPSQLSTAMNFDPAVVQQKYQAQQALSAPSAQATTSAPVVGGLPTTTPTYTKYNDQDIVNYLQDLTTKNTQGAYNPDAYNTSQQLKDALKTYNADPSQVSRIIGSGTTVPIYGGANAGGTNVNLKDYANEFAMATSKSPLLDANQRLTLDPTRATQAAQNELDTMFDPNKGSLMPIQNADFELGGKYYGQIGNRDKMISDWYNDPANQATIAAAQKSVFDKYGVPTGMRLAPRAIAESLARTEVKPAAAVDPTEYGSYGDYSAAQNAASLKAFQDKVNTYKKYGIDLMGKQDPQQLQPTSGQVTMSNLRAGLAGKDPQQAANFYGTTLENYKKSLATKNPDYYSALRTPLQQIADQTARAQGAGKPNAYATALAKKHPNVFNAALQRWSDYLKSKYPV
jgi:hypothetical protein